MTYKELKEDKILFPLVDNYIRERTVIDGNKIYLLDNDVMKVYELFDIDMNFRDWILDNVADAFFLIMTGGQSHFGTASGYKRMSKYIGNPYTPEDMSPLH